MKTKTTCKPCIKLRTIWQLATQHFRNFKRDVDNYARVEQYACELPQAAEVDVKKLPEAQQKIYAIREQARVNFDPLVLGDDVAEPFVK